MRPAYHFSVDPGLCSGRVCRELDARGERSARVVGQNAQQGGVLDTLLDRLSEGADEVGAAEPAVEFPGRLIELDGKEPVRRGTVAALPKDRR